MELESLFRLLVRVQIGLWDALDEAMRSQHGLSLVQYLPLRVIAETPNCRIQDIAVALNITTGGTSQGVDRIVAAGYCTRRPNPTDRRSSIVELTAEGDARLNAAATTVEHELQVRMGGLSPRSIDQLQKALAVLEGTDTNRSL